MAKIPKVSRIYPIPQKIRKTKRVNSAETPLIQKTDTAQLKFLKDGVKPKTKEQAKLLVAQQLYWMLKGNYKNYKHAKIAYAEFAVKHYDEVKKLSKKDMPSASIHPLSPLMPFYAIRTARILITDMFRKKSPAEIKLKELAAKNAK